MRTFVILFRYIVLSVLNFLTPKFSNRIFFYDNTFIGFNSIALIKHLDQHSKRRYKIFYFTRHYKTARNKYKTLENVKFSNNSFTGLAALLMSKFVFSEFVSYSLAHRPFWGQVNVSLWHGLALKRIGMDAGIKYPYKILNSYTYQLCYSEFAKEIMKRSFGVSDKQALISQNPRCDMLSSDKDCFSCFGIRGDYSKVVLWLPTFRNSESNGMYNSDIDFPLLNRDSMGELEKWLCTHNILLIIKLHPFQRDVEFLRGNCQNIKLIRTEDFHNVDIEFYELIGKSDALISDYSSVFYDYLLLNRPIGFVVDDYESYSKMRGFNVENPYDYMPGSKIRDYAGLIQFLDDIRIGTDNYKEERLRVCKIVNAHVDFNNCQRVLDIAGVKLL